MKIPSKNYQFPTGINFLIVTGVKEALVYRAEKGNIEEILEVVGERPEGATDSSRPGVFISGGRNMQHHGGSSENKQEKLDVKTKERFLKILKGELKKVMGKEDIESIYLFTPDFMENDIKKIITAKITDKFVNVFLGNYIFNHPLDLVKKIDIFWQGKKVKATKEEVAKILKRGKN